MTPPPWNFAIAAFILTLKFTQLFFFLCLSLSRSLISSLLSRILSPLNLLMKSKLDAFLWLGFTDGGVTTDPTAGDVLSDFLCVEGLICERRAVAAATVVDVGVGLSADVRGRVRFEVLDFSKGRFAGDVLRDGVVCEDDGVPDRAKLCVNVDSERC